MAHLRLDPQFLLPVAACPAVGVLSIGNQVLAARTLLAGGAGELAVQVVKQHKGKDWNTPKQLTTRTNFPK